MRHLLAMALASVSIVLSVGAAPADGERGSLGFSVSVDGEGFFLNPTLKSVTVASVSKGSPAARAGIVAGDMITKAEGQVIAGSKGRDLEPLMKVSVGQTLHLRLKRASGDEYWVALVAVPRGSAP